VDIAGFISEIKKGDFAKAAEIIRQTNNLPAICGRVCPQEEQCEKLCIKQKLGGPIAIGALERFVADYALSNAEPSNLKDSQTTASKARGSRAKEARAAIIGSGPAGLTCAADLARAGFKVTIYEAFHKTGGVLVYGIPEFRLPKSLVQAEIDTLTELGVEIKTNTVVGKTIMIEELLEDNDAVFIGTGAGLPMFMNIPGESLNGVYSANEYLTRVNLMKAYEKDSSTPVQTGRNVVVIGAGNVAMDAARTALRMGADSVCILYRRGREEMPARHEEIIHAEEEGIIFELLCGIKEILGDTAVNAVKCIRMKLGEPDSSNRRSPKEIPCSEFIIECDQVIMALGTNPNPLLKRSCAALETTGKGTIIVNESTGETSIKNIYAGGDAVTGSATVILAMGMGKAAAADIIKKCS